MVSAAQALDDDQYYAMLDSGTNAIIVPVHPGMKGEIADCQVPSATVTGPIVQVYSHNGAKRLKKAGCSTSKFCHSRISRVAHHHSGMDILFRTGE